MEGEVLKSIGLKKNDLSRAGAVLCALLLGTGPCLVHKVPGALVHLLHLILGEGVPGEFGQVAVLQEVAKEIHVPA